MWTVEGVNEGFIAFTTESVLRGTELFHREEIQTCSGQINQSAQHPLSPELSLLLHAVWKRWL